ncbi:MAG: phage protein Gp27 family protein [Bacteroidota bacterium]
MNLALVRSEQFNGVTCDFYRDENDIWMTREQIGTALEYENPDDAIYRIHKRHQDRLDRFSALDRLSSTDGKRYETRVYSAMGVYEICRWSRQPKADAFMDFVWNVIEALRTGQLANDRQVLHQLQTISQRLEILETKFNQAPIQLIMPTPVFKRRSHPKLSKVSPEIREQIDRMIDNGTTYDDIVSMLKQKGVDISRSSLGRYAKAYQEYKQQQESLRAQAMMMIPPYH